MHVDIWFKSHITYDPWGPAEIIPAPSGMVRLLPQNKEMGEMRFAFSSGKGLSKNTNCIYEIKKIINALVKI